MENYDLNALYLFNDGYGYRIGKIAKINEKSIRMEKGKNIRKEDFKHAHKLTEDETKIYNKELIKRIAGSMERINDMTVSIRRLSQALSISDLNCVNTDKLQKRLDELSNLLGKEIEAFKINNMKLAFNDYSEKLHEVEEN